MMSRILVATCLLLPCAVSSATDPGDSSANIRRVESQVIPVAAIRDEMGDYSDIDDRMRAYAVAGLSVAVIENGRLAWARGYGVADASTGQRVTPDTLFQGASISKPLAALGALVLVEQGKLGLDEDVNRYLKGWKVPANAFTTAHPVTLRTLLDHSSGLSDVAFDNFSPSQQLPALSQVLKDHPIRVEAVPGQRYSYTATAYVVLQQLIVDVAEQPFDAFMQARVLRPLGMTQTTFTNPLPDFLQHSAAMAHYAGRERLADGYRMGPELAVAGLWTTPSDLARYVIAVQHWNAGARDGLISPGLARQMLSPQIGYAGLGVVLSGRGKDARFGHDGFNEGFEASMTGYIHDGRGAIVMANSGFAYMLIKEVFGSISRVYSWPRYEPNSQWPPAASIGQQEITRIPDDMRATLAGDYALDATTTLRVFVQGERLYLRWPRSGNAEIFGTPDGRLFCPQLTFSEFGDPFLRTGAGELLAADGQIVLRRTK